MLAHYAQYSLLYLLDYRRDIPGLKAASPFVALSRTVAYITFLQREEND
jgi:hypothetical protein